MDFGEVIQNRRSIRKFTDDPVPRDMLGRILNAAQLAPTWAHKQGQRIIYVSTPAIRDRLVEAIGQKWTETAPAFLVVCIEPEQSGVAPNNMEYFPVDAAIVMEHLILAATNEGLGSCWIGWFNEDKVKEVLSIPNGYRVIGITPLGFFEQIPKSKERKSLEELCYEDRFGQKLRVE